METVFKPQETCYNADTLNDEGLIAVENKKKQKVTYLKTHSVNQTLDNIRQQKRAKFVRMRTSGIAFLGVLLIGLASLPLINNLQTTKEYTKVHAQVATELENLEKEREKLEYQVNLLEDEEYMAKLARRELNVSKPDEILLNLPEKEETESKEKAEIFDETEAVEMDEAE